MSADITVQQHWEFLQLSLCQNKVLMVDFEMLVLPGDRLIYLPVGTICIGGAK